MFKKSKIYIGAAIWLVVALALFLFGFRILDNSNQAAADKLTAQLDQYRQLEAEERSYQLGKKDLETLGQKPYQPADFFSKDTKLVKEVSSLEDLSSGYGLDFKLQVSGTISSAIKAPGTFGSVYLIPYGIAVTGPFENVTSFMDHMEHLGFIMHTKVINLTSADKGIVTAQLSGNFFLTK